MAGVSLKRAEKTYPKGFKAVKELDLEVQEGEFIVLTGPSGSGKSTILKMIIGLEEVTEGEIRVGDRIVNDLLPRDREVGMVSQSHGLYPHMTIYENIIFHLKINGVSREKRVGRVKELSKKLEIDRILEKKPGEVTGEDRVIAAIGKALVREPKVLLLDEPLSNLEVRSREAMGSKILKLHKRLEEAGEAVTMIYTTQDIHEAVRMGRRVCLLDQGRIV